MPPSRFAASNPESRRCYGPSTGSTAVTTIACTAIALASSSVGPPGCNISVTRQAAAVASENRCSTTVALVRRLLAGRDAGGKKRPSSDQAQAAIRTTPVVTNSWRPQPRPPVVASTRFGPSADRRSRSCPRRPASGGLSQPVLRRPLGIGRRPKGASSGRRCGSQVSINPWPRVCAPVPPRPDMRVDLRRTFVAARGFAAPR